MYLSVGSGRSSVFGSHFSDRRGRVISVDYHSISVSLERLLLDQMLKTFYHRSMDPGLSVRKQALSSITNLLMALPNNVKLQRCFMYSVSLLLLVFCFVFCHCVVTTVCFSLWLDAVLPVIVDRETSAQEKCLELMDAVLLKHLVDTKRY